MVVGGHTRVFGLFSCSLEFSVFSCQHAATLHFIILISTNKRRAVQMSGRRRPVRDANDSAPTHTHTKTHIHTDTHTLSK